MGSNAFGQLGNPTNDGKLHSIVKGCISSRSIEEIACGSHHVAALTSKAEVYTWGKGANGRLGHGNNFDRNTATLVQALKDKQVKSVVNGLRNKSKLLEAELDNTNNQLREARTTADAENLKCKAAKEVISSLTKIKSITERALEECTVNETWTGQVSKSLGSHVGENHVKDVSRLNPVYTSLYSAHQQVINTSGVSVLAKSTSVNNKQSDGGPNTDLLYNNSMVS
ncbi:hypothetical protein ACQ4PT_011527 [Festuca glaucescens]